MTTPNPYQSPHEKGSEAPRDLERRSIHFMLIGLAILSLLSALSGLLRHML
jgi:hypothetical protein